MDDNRKKDHRRDPAPPRVRLAKHIDLSKAKSGCKRCNGRGITGYKRADLGDGEGEKQIPIICRCVSRNAGVKEDELDRICREAKHQIETGVFHEHLAADYHAIPQEQKPRVVAAFYRDCVDTRKSDESREAVVMTLDLLKRRKDWDEMRTQAVQILQHDAIDISADSNSRSLSARAAKLARAEMN